MTSAFVAFLILLTTAMTFTPPRALAADGRDLSNELIKTAQITRVGNLSPDKPLQAGETVSFSFTWDASNVSGTTQAPKAGDFIKIDAPQWLRFTGARIDMKDPSGNVVAKCTEVPTNPTSVTCTFTDFVESNPIDLRGEYSTTMAVQTAQTITDKSFKVGPVELHVTNLVNDEASDAIVQSPSGPRTCQPLTEDFTKTGGWDGANASSNGQAQLWWDLKFPGTGGDVKITDTLLLPQTHGTVKLWVRDGSTESDTKCTWLSAGSTNGAATDITGTLDVDWSKTANGEDSASIVVPNTEVGKHYRVVIYAYVPADAFKEGSSLANEATVNEHEVSGSVKVTRVTNASASGNPDLGGVWVYKAVTGDGRDLVPSATSFTVKATWTQDGVEKTENLTVTAGDTPSKLENLPKGTKVTLSEIEPADGTGYTWGDPVFADGRYGNATSDQVVVAADKQSAVVTIKGGENWPILVTNKATKPSVGKFSVTKVVEDPDNVAQGKTFNFNYTCTLSGQPDITGTLQAKAGETVASGDIPAGYSCNVNEDTASASVDGATLIPTAGDPVTIVADQTVNTKFTNAYSRDVSAFTITKVVEGDVANLPTDLTFEGTYVVNPPNGDPVEGKFSVRAGETFTSPTFPVGSRVTLKETAPTAPANIDWAEPKFSTNDFVLEKGVATEVTLTNTASTQLGMFTVVKSLEGTQAAKDLVPVDTEFIFEYSYPAGPGFAAGNGTITAKADGTAVSSEQLPIGAEVTLTEQTPAPIDGIAWEEARITPETFTVEKDNAVSITATNPVAETLGGFSLVKKVSGTGSNLVPEGTIFTVDYTWTTDDGQTGNGVVDVVAGGEPVVVSGIPGGATVTLSEHTPAYVEGVEWLDPVFSTNGFSVIAGEIVTVDLDNPTQLKQGAFSIRKAVAGTGASLVPADASFTVNYSYPAGSGFEAGEGTLTVKADGTIIQSDPLPYGAVVTFTELTPADLANAKWLGGKFDQETITIGDGTVTQVVLTNNYDEIPPTPEAPTPPTPGVPTKPTPGVPTPPAPGVPTKPTPGQQANPTSGQPSPSPAKPKTTVLAQTGPEVAAIGALAVAFLVGGIGLLATRRNKAS